jgi:hypothetical protein
MANGGGSHYQRAIGDRFGDSLVHLSARQRGRRTNGGASITECHVVRIHQPQMWKSKIAHGPRGRADVQGVAHVHKDHA